MISAGPADGRSFIAKFCRRPPPHRGDDLSAILQGQSSAARAAPGKRQDAASIASISEAITRMRIHFIELSAKVSPATLFHMPKVSTLFLCGFDIVLWVFGVLFPRFDSAADLPRTCFSPHINALAIDCSTYTGCNQKTAWTSGKPTPSWNFQEGKIAFFQSFEGRITGFVGSGIGHVVALPRDPGKSSRWRGLGAPVPTSSFSAVRAIHGRHGLRISARTGARGFNARRDEKFARLWGNKPRSPESLTSLRSLSKIFKSPSALFHAESWGAHRARSTASRREQYTIHLGKPRTVGKVPISEFEFVQGARLDPFFQWGIDNAYTIDTAIIPTIPARQALRRFRRLRGLAEFLGSQGFPAR